MVLAEDVHALTDNLDGEEFLGLRRASLCVHVRLRRIKRSAFFGSVPFVYAFPTPSFCLSPLAVVLTSLWSVSGFSPFRSHVLLMVCRLALSRPSARASTFPLLLSTCRRSRLPPRRISTMAWTTTVSCFLYASCLLFDPVLFAPPPYTAFAIFTNSVGLRDGRQQQRYDGNKHLNWLSNGAGLRIGCAAAEGL